MLAAKNISYSIGNIKLLHDVSVNFLPGKLNLVIGPNGAGKSTLIKILCGQLQPQQGSVLYGNCDIASIPLAARARMRAVLSQHIELAFPLKVAEVVMMGRYPHFTGTPTAQDHTACEEAMRFFDIDSMAARDYTTLSGGEQQRVHFARVAAQVWHPVAQGCRLLILDEPLTFLDVRYQFDFMHKVKALLQSPDLLVVGVVHDLNLAAKFAHHITLLHQGKVQAFGSRDEVLTKEHIKTAYQLEPVIHRDGDAMYLFFE